MTIIDSLRLFRPLFKCAKNMTTPVQELKIAGANAGKAENTIGDIAEFSTKAKSGELDNVCKKLFCSYEDFKSNALKRLREYKGSIPEEIYTAAEKSVESNQFELTKAIKGYYSKLNECKTLEEVAAIYPEFAHLNIDMANELKSMIKLSIPESVCKEAMQLTTKEERLKHIIKYMEDATNNCVKGWESYPDIIRLQHETAVEIANGLYSGSADAQAGLKFFCNKEPLRFYLLDKKDRDNVILSYLKQYYLEGKSMQNIVPETVKGRVMSPGIINGKGFHISNPSLANFRTAISTIERDAGEYKAISRLSSGEINSAVMKRTWAISALKADMANETKFGKGWTNVKNILIKRKGIENDISSSEEMINRYLLNRFKANNRTVTEKNPFLKFENPETDRTDKIKRFVNSMYHVNAKTMSDRMILKSEEFQKFKSEFDIEGMKESIANIEDQYINIFFKRFWTDERKGRFTAALRKAGSTVQENIKISDSILMQALSESVV